MDAQGAAAAFGKNGEISTGLRSFHHTEGVFLSGDRQILGIIASDLQENAAIGTALVGLPGGMQEARAKAQNRGHFFLVADRMPDALQYFFVSRIHCDVPKDPKIIACSEPRKMGFQNISKVWAMHGSHILFVGKQFEAACLEKWHFD